MVSSPLVLVPQPVAPQQSWRFPHAKLIEVSGHQGCARMTTAVAAVLQAQAEEETVAWLQLTDGPLYPPDLLDSGIDLDALVVVQIPAHETPFGLLKAAEILLRSGSLGLAVLDLSQCQGLAGQTAWQGRLLSLAREHNSRLLLLTHTHTNHASLGPLVGLRFEPRRIRQSPGIFAVQPYVLKNKSGLPMTSTLLSRRGPWGLP